MFKLDDPTNRITYTTGAGPRTFGSEKAFAALADSLGLTRLQLEAIWNDLAGRLARYPELKRVKKFRNRPYGVKQIWKVIQRLVPKEPTKEPRATKSHNVINLLKRENGVSGEELQQTTGWKPHTVRGFISTLQSKHGLKIKGTREEGRGMVYRIPA